MKAVSEEFRPAQGEGVVTETEVENIIANHSLLLNESFKKLETTEARSQCFNGRWKDMKTAPRDGLLNVDSGFPIDVLRYIGLKSVETPEGFVSNRADNTRVFSRLRWKTF